MEENMEEDMEKEMEEEIEEEINAFKDPFFVKAKVNTERVNMKEIPTKSYHSTNI